MAQRIGKCTNYATCQLAFKNADIEAEHEFVCPECGQPLREIAAVAAPAGPPKKELLLYGGIGAGVLILGLVVFFVFKSSGDKEPPVTAGVEQATPVPEPTPAPATPRPVVIPPPVTTPPPTPKPPVPPTPRSATPIPATPAPEEEEMPTTTAVFDRNPQSEENKTTRAEVLKRIDHIPNLSPADRAKLEVRVNKAKEMLKVITVPFGVAKRTLSPAVAEKLCEATRAPQVQQLAKDPTVVFVILGFSDTAGSAEAGLKLSTARADAVTDSLRNRCKLLNLMQPVGMGSSTFFDADKKEKNRVAEVWAVIP